MKLASKFAFFKRKTKDQQIQQQGALKNSSEVEVDTNVVGIGFDILKNITDRAIQNNFTNCSKCDSVLNSFSKLIKAQDYLDLIQPQKKEGKNDLEKIEEDNDELQQSQHGFVLIAKKNDQVFEIKEGESVWICEFCGTINKVKLLANEVPIHEDVIYLIQSSHQVQLEKQNLHAEQTVIMCIDNSGSMSSTTEVEGKINLKHGLSPDEYEMLKQFIDPGDEDQMFPGMHKKNITHVSRKQCVLAALESQVNEMKLNSPNKILGLVTFNNEVVLIGDGSSQPVTLTGDRLYVAEEIREIATQAAPQLLSKTVKEASHALLERFQKIQEKGQTALGPALLAAVQLAKSGNPGSMVILCTDGLANLGLGYIQSTEQAQVFYGELALDAKNSGIAISVVTIKGEGCRMDILGQLAETTNGNVTRVNPSEIGQDFANILKDEVVGTQVVLIVKLHSALKFRNEDQSLISKDGQTLRRDIGNATVNTQVTFEYELKTDEELQSVGVDVTALKEVPFQARIEYTNLNGDKLLRVLTWTVSTTEDLQQAEQEANVDVIHTRIKQETAKHVRRGSYQKAQEYNGMWDNYVQSNQQMNQQVSNQRSNQEYSAQNMQLNKLAMKKETRELMKQQKKMPKDANKGDQPEGFFAKLFTKNKKVTLSSQQQQQQAVVASNKPAYSVQQKQEVKIASNQSQIQRKMSESDEDAEEAEVMQFCQAKHK